MKLQEIRTYDDLEEYLKTFRTFGGDTVTYDFNGIVHLILALTDNLMENSLEAELNDIGGSMTNEQREFWIKISEGLNR
ncbi:MAG: hypothetical protein GY795_24445 [Desulfobacterales bacterium]|nr:hypothetical protein [Desulfobacterales bacterium]